MATRTKTKQLSAKEALFVKEYLVDLNATQAYIRAGYSARTAMQCAHMALKKPHVQAAVQAEMQKRSERTEVTADRVLSELARMGFSNMLDYIKVDEYGGAQIDLSALTRDQASAIQEVTVDTYSERDGDEVLPVKRIKFKLVDKKGPLELIGRHLNMFPQRHELTGKNGGPIETKELSPIERAKRIAFVLAKAKKETASGKTV